MATATALGFVEEKDPEAPGFAPVQDRARGTVPSHSPLMTSVVPSAAPPAESSRSIRNSSTW